MARTNRVSLRALGWAAGAALTWSGAALGQAGEGDKPALSGPPVQERKMPGSQARFGGGGDRRAALEARAPGETMRRVIAELKGEGAPADLRLTADQVERLAAVEREHRERMGEYLREHRADLEEVRAALGEERFAQLRRRLMGARAGDLPRTDAKAPGDRPADRPRDRDAEPPAPMQEEPMMREGGGADAPAAGAMSEEAARARLLELLAGAPRPEEAANRAWNVLTDAQRAWAQERLAALRAEADQRMTEAYAQRLMEERRQGGDAPAPGQAQRPFNDERIPPRLRERIASLPEEQRARVMQHIRERLQRGEWTPEAMRRLYRRLEQQAADKPAPSMDSVDVPPPEKAGDPGR